MGGGGSPEDSRENEQPLNLESGRQPVEGLDFEPFGLIGGGCSPKDLDRATTSNFAGDSTVPRVRNGLDPASRKAFWEPELFGFE
jgi:hypothetical protein